ncbi:MAG: efflux RND transporter periplasmic adaptor subunit [Acidobacteriota bacterium]
MIEQGLQGGTPIESPEPRGRGPWRTVAALVLGGLLLVGAYWLGERSRKELPATGGAGEAAGPVSLPPGVEMEDDAAAAIGLKLEPVEIRPVDRTLRLTGSIVAPPDARGFVGSRLEGRIASVLVNVGDRVREGETLATVQSAQFEDLQVELLRAAAELPVARAAADRLKKLLEIQAVAAKEVESASAQYEAKRSEYAGVRERLEILGLSKAQIGAIESSQELIRTLAIKAPLGGVVVSRTAVAGSPVNTSDPILEIDKLDTLWAEGDVFETQLAEIKPGLKVHVTVPGVSRVAAGTVQGLVPSLDPAKRTARLRVVLDNSVGDLTPGMFASLVVTVGTEAAGVSVPVGALIEQGGAAFVFVKNGTQLAKQDVVVSARDDRYAQISRGLFEHDLVVTDGKMQVYTKSLYQ